MVKDNILLWTVLGAWSWGAWRSTGAHFLRKWEKEMVS